MTIPRVLEVVCSFGAACAFGATGAWLAWDSGRLTPNAFLAGALGLWFLLTIWRGSAAASALIGIGIGVYLWWIFLVQVLNETTGIPTPARGSQPAILSREDLPVIYWIILCIHGAFAVFWTFLIFKSGKNSRRLFK